LSLPAAGSGLLDLVDAAVLRLDAQGIVTVANAAARELLGHDPVGLGLGAALRACSDETLQAPLAGGPVEASMVEALTARGRATLAMTIRPMPAGSDGGGWIVTLNVDVATSAREVAHRLKNQLATVQALATQGMSKSSVREFLPLFLDRLQALAQVYDLLARQGWRRAGLVDLACSVLVQRDGRAEQYEFALTDRLLRPQVAQTLALTLQELAANARRFGALSRVEGKVRLASDGEAKGDLDLVWQELGAPLISPPNHRGFGLRSLGRMLGQHNGRCEFDWQPSGLVCRIVVPANEADPY
jgi:two-component sensor histidine kinase